MNAALEFVQAKEKDLGGGFVVRRLLPAARHSAVGPFVFFDHFGPIEAGPKDQHDVRPHPHIGLATVTYLFEGAMMHRDSTGVVQRIEPGAVNLMSAGRGIVHSERTPDDLRQQTRRSHGLQLWLALPESAEESEPGFSHTAESEIPRLSLGGADVRLLIGSAFGLQSPVQTASPTLYLDIRLAAGDAFLLPLATQRALYVVEGDVALDGRPVPVHTMVVLAADDEPMVSASGSARAVLIGGEPLGQRFLWWNFVSTRKERITQAADDWQAGRFAAVAGETEFIPLPPRP